MARVQTSITGITTTSAYEEGNCYSLVNLRPKNGALHPVSPRKIVRDEETGNPVELSQNYNIVFVHQNNDYRNLIGIVNNADETSSVYWEMPGSESKEIKLSIDGKISAVEQTGNTLSLITESRIYYLFYKDEDYTFLGELPELPPIKMQVGFISSATAYFKDHYREVDKDNFIDATKGLVNKCIDAFINGANDENGNFQEGYGLSLFDAHFIRYAFRLYDGTLTKHSPPILVMPTKDILSMKTITYLMLKDGVLSEPSKVEVSGYKITLRYDFTGLDAWKDIIQSIDLFLSQPLGISNIENIRHDLPLGTGDYKTAENLIKEITSENIKAVTEASTFYYMRSIELGDKSMLKQFPSGPDEISRLENIIYQEPMSNDSFSHHTYGAQKSYDYNGRLHLGNIKTTFFKGFDMSFFQWLSDYNGIENNSGGINSIVVETELQAGPNTEKVYSRYDGDSPIMANSLFASAFLSYPDPRAKRITVYEVNNNVWRKVFSAPLKAHNLLNLAYYLHEGIKPITESDATVITQIPDTTKNATLSEPNKIKVSQLDNPLLFPNKNVYAIGNGTVLAMATNAMNVSDRNYGQYPLYVFTDRGIWTLNVGSGEVVYSALATPTYPEAPLSGIVGETPYGVVFTTKRGLMIINGQSVDSVSPQIEQECLPLVLGSAPQLEGVLLNFNPLSLREYLENVSDIIYNPYENELILCNKESAFNCVLNFDSRSYYQSTEKIDLAVGNVFPELLIVSESRIKDYAASDTSDTHVSLITRPLLYGTGDLKRLERMILRSVLFEVKNPAPDKKSFVLNYSSIDGVRFSILRGIPLSQESFKDFDMGLFARSTYRQFVFAFAGMINENSQIYFLDTEIAKGYDNTKMR